MPLDPLGSPISSLSAADTPLDGTEALTLVQSTRTKRTLLSRIADYVIQVASSFTQSGSGASETDLQTRGRLVVFANDFGTKMVTTPAADINLAITAVNTAGGGTVIVPKGNYTAETTIVPKSNVWLRGAGITGTKITLADDVDKDLIRNPNNTFGSNGPDTNIRISDMELDGNKSANDTAGHSPDAYNACIRLKNVERCVVENVYAHHALGYGVELKSALDCIVRHCYASDNGDDGFSVSEFGLGEVSHSKRNTFVSCYAWDNQPDHGQTSGSGFEVDDGPQDTSFIDCHAWDNEIGLYFHEHATALAPIGLTVIGGSYNNNDDFGIASASQEAAGLLADSITIIGAECNGNTVTGIDISGSSNVSITGARVAENDATGISVKNSLDFNINGCYLRANATRGIIVQTATGTTSNGLITGCTIRRDGVSTTHGIRIADSSVSAVALRGNDLRDSTASSANYISDLGTSTVILDNLGPSFRTVTLTASVNDFNPDTTGAPVWRVQATGASPWTITGIASVNRFPGRVLTLINVDSADSFIIAHNDSGSADANKILVPTGEDQVVEPGDEVALYYDETTTRWRMIEINTAKGVKSAHQLLSAVSGATVTATNLIPAGAVLLGVRTQITTALGAGNGTTGYSVGDGSDADMFGVAAAITAGTTTDNADATVDPTGWAAAARSVVLTATTGNFDGTGAVLVVAHYFGNM